jgi:hypothetical protein
MHERFRGRVSTPFELYPIQIGLDDVVWFQETLTHAGGCEIESVAQPGADISISRRNELVPIQTSPKIDDLIFDGSLGVHNHSPTVDLGAIDL